MSLEDVNKKNYERIVDTIPAGEEREYPYSGDFFDITDVSTSLEDLEVKFFYKLVEQPYFKASEILPANTIFTKVKIKNISSSDVNFTAVVGRQFKTSKQISVIVSDVYGLATENTLSNIKSNIDIALSSLRDSLLAEEQVYEQLIGADETVDQSITLDTKGHDVVSIWAEATTATTFKVEFSNDNTNWVTYYTSSAAETSHKENIQIGFRYVRLSSVAAGASGDTVTLILAAK